MGKNEFLTPKAIANRIKAKGLQKLRWYCQMCQKQCRDENGFKCHCMSESHQRQMSLFGQNPHRIVDGFSDEFQTGFMDLLKRSHRFSRIAATVVYNEYINDRHHVHMNSTKWATLTEFVKHLGKEGLCKVEDTPKGWFITYIDRDSETIFKDRLKAKRLKADLVDEERQEKAIQAQIERALMAGSTSEISNLGLEGNQESESGISNPGLEENKELESGKGLNGGKVAFLMKNGEEKGKSKIKLGFEMEETEEREKGVERKREKEKERERVSVLDELMREEEKKKEKVNRKDYWLCEGIIVKVMSKSLADKGYYKQKGVIKKVIDKYTAEIEMLENKHKLRVDQEELETVIPQIGGIVRIVNGAYRGERGRLLDVDVKKFCARVEIEKGVYDGRVLKAVDYEDICKLA